MVYTKNCGLPRLSAPASFEGKVSFSMYLKMATVLLACTSFGVHPWRVANAQTPGQVVSNHAEDFTVSYETNYKLVTHVPSNTTMALYREGTVLSPDLGVDAVFKIPLQTVAVTSTSMITFLELLGERTTIAYVDGFTTSFVTSPCVVYLLNENEIGVIPSNDTEEAELLNTIDATFISYSQDLSYPTILDTSTSDPGTLQRSEWIKYYSVFFDKEDRANEVFNAMEARYTCQRDFAQGFNEANRPLVAWVNVNTFGDFSVSISDAAYKRQYTEDAGGRFFAPEGALGPYNSTYFFAFLDENNVDIIIDETYDPSPSSTDPARVLANFNLTEGSSNRFVAEQRIWRQDGLLNSEGTGLDWFESSLPEADVVLEDLISTFHSEPPYGADLTNDAGGRFTHERVWLRNVFTETVTVEELSCTSADEAAAALDVRADECVIGSGGDGSENGAAHQGPVTRVVSLLAVAMCATVSL